MGKAVLILTPFYPPNIGGAETFCLDLVNQAKKWFNVTILTLMPFKKEAQKYEEYYYKRGHLRIHRLNWIIKHGQVWQGFGLFNFIKVFPIMFFGSLWLMLRRKFDVIHAQGLICGLVGVFLKWIFRKKLCITLLALYDFNDRVKSLNIIAKFILNNCDIIFVEGLNGLKDIKYLKVDESKVRIFNHWVDQDIFKPPLKRANDKIRVLFVGRPIPEKGRHIIEGVERELDNKAYEFTYVEDVEYKDLPGYYQRSHICVVPSLYSEGYSRVVAESASCGCIVVTSNKGSLTEMVRDWGYAVGPTPEEFINIIEGFRLRGHDYFGEKSFEYAKNHFSSRNAEVFLSAYSS